MPLRARLRAVAPARLRVGVWLVRSLSRRDAFSRLADGLRNEGAPELERLESIHRAWHGQSGSADVEYLRLMLELAEEHEGPVLECGSGLSTIVLGLSSGRRVYSLEHDETWYLYVRRVVRKLGLTNVTVLHCPIGSYGSFSWYEAPLETLPERFSVVVCDGPPCTGDPMRRYGVVPVLGERVRSAVILLDDAEREGERATLKRWADEHGYSVGYTHGGKAALAYGPECSTHD